MAGMLISAGIRSLGQESRPPTGSIWSELILFAAVGFAAVFLIFFAWNLWSVVRSEQVNEILETEAAESERLKTSLYAFVAMEFYALMWNRTFAIFVAPEGLYGWKASGVVTNSDRRFYEPLRELVTDPDLASDLPAIRKLAAVRGGFFYPRAEITAVSSDGKSQWGMGGIANSGHVTVRLASGKRRKFIVLGEAIPEEVRDRIATTLGVGIPSTE